MSRTGRLCLATFGALILLAEPGTMAHGQQPSPTIDCGADDGSGGEVRAEFALDTDSSTLDVKVDRRAKSISIVLTSSCIISPDNTPLTVSIRPGKADTDDFPALPTISPAYGRDEVTVTIPVSSETFEPGSYDAVVAISGANATTAKVPVTASVKSEFWLTPLLAALLGLVLGLLAAGYVAWSNQGDNKTAASQPDAKPLNPAKGVWKALWSWTGLVAAIAALVAVSAVFKELYVDSDTWVNEVASSWTMLVRSITAASSATIVTYLGKGLVNGARRE